LPSYGCPDLSHRSSGMLQPLDVPPFSIPLWALVREFGTPLASFGS
jgi:hypothetical protein